MERTLSIDECTGEYTRDSDFHGHNLTVHQVRIIVSRKTMPAKSSQRNTRRATYSRNRLRMSIPPLHDPRRDEDEIRAAWRRDVLGIPNRFDRWLEREVELGLTSPSPPRTGNVRCVLTVSFEEVRLHEFFLHIYLSLMQFMSLGCGQRRRQMARLRHLPSAYPGPRHIQVRHGQ